MDEKLRNSLRQTLSITLELLPRWVKHDFWRQCQPQHDRAKEAMVEKLIEAVDADFELTERTDKECRGWQ